MRVQWLEQTASDVPEKTDWLSTSEQERVSSFRVPKRRTDWRMGRWTAKHAVAAYLNLSQSHPRLADIEIRPTEFGVPRVFIADQPAAITISISHRSVWAVCAVAPADAMLGCDLEIVEPRSDAFLRDYFTAHEQALITLASPADRDRLANLLWSAKESALKALGVGLTVDSRTTDVTFLETPTGNEPSQAAAWHILRVTHIGGQIFHGWWQCAGTLLRTMVASPAPSQPAVIKLQCLVRD